MIAIDWGSTSLRAYRLSPAGKVLEKRQAAQGILALKSGGFADALQAQVGDWISAGEAPIVMSGMVGSRQGWLEVPYVHCPAGIEEISRNMASVALSRNEKAWLVPGLSCLD